MKKIIIALFVFAFFAIAGDWGYTDIEGASGGLFSFDTIEAVYTNTYEIGNGKKVPTYVYFSYWLTPTSVDTVNFSIRLDYSNDQSKWYNYGDLDTVSIDSSTTTMSDETNGTIQVSPYSFRYFRLYLQSNTADTFGVYLQKSHLTE